MRPSPGRGIASLLAAASLAGLCGCADLPSLAPPEHHATSSLPVSQETAAAWISGYRRRHGLAAVTVDPALQRVAQAQADAMASANRLSHTVAGSLSRRLGAVAEARRAYIENVSAGYSSLESALDGWRRSPEHNENLLFKPMRRVGVAGANAPGTRFKTFWSLVMTD